MLRIGQGFDLHRFAENGKVIIGGVFITEEYGLIAHSDGDVLAHAIIDALTGAVGLPDIGELFPNTDSEYQNADSIELLEKVINIYNAKGYVIQNIDCTLICEKPKISPYKIQMIEKLSRVMRIRKDQINIKGKTAERIGALGREEGIAALVSCLVEG